ncbi:hypothetical protein F5Y15DRAFT_126692 [Xylariaceae sp. FL0016]|nr:hypothetical protein F5Y15DRAFT_126692 [Xylariaceae sp. FL0016]
MAATARMLCLGNLDCLRRIELYITSLSKRLITDRNYFKKFVQDVLDTCRNAADGKPHHFCYSRRSPRNSGVSEPALAEYSKQYIHDQWHELSRRQDSSHAPSELLASSRMATRSKSSSLPFPSSQRSTTAASDTLSSIHDDITSQTSFAPSDTKSCPRCEKVYSGKSAATSLSRHLRKHQSNPDRYSCPYCTKKDSRSCNLSKHIEKVHPTMFVPKFGKRGKQRQPAVSQPPS